MPTLPPSAFRSIAQILRTTGAVTMWCALSTQPFSGHHSAAVSFDASKPVKLTGTVTRIEWANPHAIFYTDVRTEDGKVENWGWELPSPNQLMRAGWMRDSMKTGDSVTVQGIRARDGGTHGMATTVVLASTGKRLFAGQAER
ncbi:MAG: DUF6152 family protein [Vicinamibacterales bacterium]